MEKITLRAKVEPPTPAALQQLALRLGYKRPVGYGVITGHTGAMLDAIAAGRLQVEAAA